MIVKKKDRIRHENSKQCIAYEYSFDEKDINVAFVEINGRYPETGFVMNTKVKEIVFITEGSGKIFIEDDEFVIKEGDTILIHPNKKFFWQGKIKDLASCAPAWNTEQYRYLE
ncbi:MAG: AraC family ligand binding domain-containing protein [Candidatus Aenigmatarchaeota archaeon]